jgi:hypothetical protein
MNVSRKASRCLCPLIALFLPLFAAAQESGKVVFGCGEEPADFTTRPPLAFEPIAAPDGVSEWYTRPVLVFTGFKAAEQGFTEIRFYRWHVPEPSRTGGWGRDSTERLEFALQLTTPQGPQWFHLRSDHGVEAESFLYIQPDPGDIASGDAQEESDSIVQDSAETHDEMTSWLVIRQVSVDSSLPIFLLDYAYNDSGANTSGTIRNKLLLNFEKGVPRISRAVQCIDWEGGGACGALDNAAAVAGILNCPWDPAADDFRCSLVSAYGGTYSPMRAQRDFYLLSDKVVASPPDVVPNLVALTERTRGVASSKLPAAPVVVNGVGPTTLLAHYTDLLPSSEAFLFASPAAGNKIASHFSLVTIAPNGKSQIETILKWDISAEEPDEAAAPQGFTPMNVNYQYRVNALEGHTGFRALAVILTSPQPGVDSNTARVVYWIGLEVVQGALVTNAVRLASNATSYGGCNQWLADGSASLIQRKPGLAEATVRVQGQEVPMVAEDQPQACPWVGVLHWKAASGFRVRKLKDLCDSPAQLVSISEEGAVSSKAVTKNAPQ